MFGVKSARYYPRIDPSDDDPMCLGVEVPYVDIREFTNQLRAFKEGLLSWFWLLWVYLIVLMLQKSVRLFRVNQCCNRLDLYNCKAISDLDF